MISCPACGKENDLSAVLCRRCRGPLREGPIDDAQLEQAAALHQGNLAHDTPLHRGAAPVSAPSAAPPEARGAESEPAGSDSLGEVCRRCESYNEPGTKRCATCGAALVLDSVAAQDLDKTPPDAFAPHLEASALERAGSEGPRASDTPRDGSLPVGEELSALALSPEEAAEAGLSTRNGSSGALDKTPPEAFQLFQDAPHETPSILAKGKAAVAEAAGVAVGVAAAGGAAVAGAVRRPPPAGPAPSGSRAGSPARPDTEQKACGKCGEPNPPAARFCFECGMPFARSAAGVEPALAPPPRTSAPPPLSAPGQRPSASQPAAAATPFARAPERTSAPPPSSHASDPAAFAPPAARPPLRIEPIRPVPGAVPVAPSIEVGDELLAAEATAEAQPVSESPVREQAGPAARYPAGPEAPAPDIHAAFAHAESLLALDPVVRDEPESAPGATAAHDSPVEHETISGEDAWADVAAPADEALPVADAGAAGSDAEEPEVLSEEIAEPSPPYKASMVLEKGSNAWTAFALEHMENAVGTAGAAIAIADDPFVAPRAATVLFDGDRMLVRDEGSANGVYVRVRESASLDVGALFFVGERLLRFDGPCDLPQTHEGPVPFLGGPRSAGAPVRVTEVLLGGKTGRTCHRAGPAIAIGRTGCDMNFPADSLLAARHAEIRLAEDGSATIVDLGQSPSGVFLRVRSQGTQELRPGDVIRVGEQELRVEVG